MLQTGLPKCFGRATAKALESLERVKRFVSKFLLDFSLLQQ
jgi:hypothetical protein